MPTDHKPHNIKGKYFRITVSRIKLAHGRFE